MAPNPAEPQKGQVKIAGIPTDYSEITFRSRLEAQWAAFMDILGIDWDYEPFDCDGWIPDFIIKGSQPLLIDVKPVANVPDCVQYFRKIKDSKPPYPFAVVGLGALGEKHAGSEIFGAVWGSWPDSENQGDDYDIFHFAECHKCKKYTWACIWGSYQCRRCGHYDGDNTTAWGEGEVSSAWNQAKNLVRWEPKRK